MFVQMLRLYFIEGMMVQVMRILLIACDFPRKMTQNQILDGFNPPSLGVNYLAAILRNQGHKVLVLDTLYQFLLSPQETVTFVGSNLEVILAQEEIELVGLSVTSPTRSICFEIAKRIKEYDSCIPIVVGGPHAILLKGQLLLQMKRYVDVVVIDNGEIILPTLVETIEKERSLITVPGIAFLQFDKIIETSHQFNIGKVRSLPFPDYKQYSKIEPQGLVGTVAVSTSRGCPFQCRFCCASVLWEDKVQYRSEKDIADEICQMQNLYGTTRIYFSDDSFFFPKYRSKTILRHILDRGVSAKTLCSGRFDSIDKEILSLFRDLGEGMIYFGLESGSYRLRQYICKSDFSNNYIRKICDMVKDHGIGIGLHVIFGLPTETEKEISETEQLLDYLAPNEVSAHICNIHLGTSLYDEAIKCGIYRPEAWQELKPDFFYFEKSPKQLEHLRKMCKRIETRHGPPLVRSGLFQEVGSSISS